MAIDWGKKRLGIAVTDPRNLIAGSLTLLHRRGACTPWEALGKLIGELGVGTIVVGVPFRTDGKTGEKESIVRDWIEEARRKFPGLRIVETDERFTTLEAKRLLREKGVRAVDQRDKLDKVAAALILEQFLSRAKP